MPRLNADEVWSFILNAVTRHNVKITGNGTIPMMFAHGFGCDQNMWRLVTPSFEKDYKIVLFDYVGHGRSDLSAYDRARYDSLDGYADDVLEICEELNLRDVVFVGHSVSAAIGIIAAIRDPSRFANLILVGPSPRYINEGDYVGGFTRTSIDELLDFLDSNHLGWSSAMAPVIMGNADRPELGTELANSFCRTDPEVAKHFARVTFLSDTRDDLPKLKVPSLIIQCSDDIIAPACVGQYVHAQLPDSRLIILDANGHCPHLSQPAETVQAMKTYLEKAGDL
jgi:sigma-B regulation protein RsbQ